MGWTDSHPDVCTWCLLPWWNTFRYSLHACEVFIFRPSSTDNILSRPSRFLRGFSQRRRISGRGTVGGSPTTGTSSVWSCPSCTFDNSDWLSVCEMCGTNRSGDDGLLSAELSSDSIPLDELRRRRVQRFERWFRSIGKCSWTAFCFG